MITHSSPIEQENNLIRVKAHIPPVNANAIPEFLLTYSFNYSQFDSSDLQELAKNTLRNFISFVRETFDGLLENGKALQNLYDECLATCTDGKKVFDSWLATECGASRYVASSAMKISAWFEKLPIRLQCLVRQHVQQWKVSALLQLTRVTDNLLEELVSTGKKTAAQVKQMVFKGQPKQNKGKKVSRLVKTDAQSELDTQLSVQSEIVENPQLAPGVRIVVINDSTESKSQPGIITEIDSNGEFWVLLDQTVRAGMLEKYLFNAHQLKPEAQKEQMFCTAEVEQIKALAIKEYETVAAEKQLLRFLEIKGAALESAQKEIISFQNHAQKLAQEKEQLIKQLAACEREIERLNSLHIKNQQLEQRVTELEKALLISNQNNWGNTFTTQAAKVVNSKLEKTVPLLMLEVKRLQSLVQEKDIELAQIKTLNASQQEELIILQQTLVSESDSIIYSFGEVGENQREEWLAPFWLSRYKWNVT